MDGWKLELPLVEGYSTVHKSRPFSIRLDTHWTKPDLGPDRPPADQGVWPDRRPVPPLCVLSEVIRAPGNSFAAAGKEFRGGEKNRNGHPFIPASELKNVMFYSFDQFSADSCARLQRATGLRRVDVTGFPCQAWAAD